MPSGLIVRCQTVRHAPRGVRRMREVMFWSAIAQLVALLIDLIAARPAPPGPACGAGHPDDGAALASRPGPAEMVIPARPARRSPAHRRDARNPDRPAGAREPALGLRPRPR